MGRRPKEKVPLELDPDVWRLVSDTPVTLIACKLCRTGRNMVEGSVRKHMKLEKHIELLAELHLARTRTCSIEDAAASSMHDMVATGIPCPPASQLPEAPEPAPLVPSTWQPFDGLPDELCEDESVVGDDDLIMSSDASSSKSESTSSDAPLSEYNSDNEADDEEWDLPEAEPTEPTGETPQNGESSQDPLDNEDGAGTRKHRRNEPNIWWPFKSQEYLVASLLIGYTHTLISRSLYNHIKMLFKLFDIVLPDWSTIRNVKKGLRDLLRMDIKGSISILKNPTYGLSLPNILAQEVANPIVSPSIDYYPQEAHGQDVYKLSQSRKWLEELEPMVRAPMCRVGEQDWYLFEPVQTKSDKIVIPLFFYSEGGEMYAKCVAPNYHFNSNGVHLRLTFPAGLPFRSNMLESLLVSDFDLDCNMIAGVDGVLLLDRCRDSIYELADEVTTWHHVPNPWRQKADGRIIRHLPITLYSNDTSGNQSKRWNKHISYYFTLSGLPPKWTNQNYNCHYLSTYNEGGAMELAGPIVSDLRMMSSDGFAAFDCTIQEEVLLTSTVLCFLGDSPMHAEITSTPIPGNALHPCRMCPLSACNVKEKATFDYVARFFMISPTGSWITPFPRSWPQIKANCYKVWEMAHQPQKKTAVENSASKLGVKDVLSRTLIDQRYEIIGKASEATPAEADFLQNLENTAKISTKSLFNTFFELAGFDGCRDTPVEVLHVFLLGVVKYMVQDFMRNLRPSEKPLIQARYRSFNIDGLNIPSMQADYLTRHFANFIGKDFRIVVQVAPFVLFEYMDEEEVELWAALCKLAPLIFQTHIEDMNLFQDQLSQHIRQFLFLLVKNTAQWVNKPKIHMLLHLLDSISRYGPASLFATEKMEGYNSILRNASVHSNQHSPSRDIGVSFGDYHNLRHLVSGGFFYDYKRKVYCSAGVGVVGIFANNRSIQRSMGFNSGALDNSSGSYPSIRKWRVLESLKVGTPAELQSFLTGYEITQVHEVSWTCKDVILPGSFVVYKSCGSTNSAPALGRVDHLWRGRKGRRVVLYLCVAQFDFGEVDGFYNMRTVTRRPGGTFISVANLVAKLNMQHNCHRGECPVCLTKRVRVEQQDTNKFTGEVAHTNEDNYVVNLASLLSTLAHRKFSDIAFEAIPDHGYVEALHEGLAKWHAASTRTGPPGPVEAIDPGLQ
ncbi:hypothetical protein PTTG_09104 [Puccinia triticina 1-1 BBBD Race 1]|uniref:Uncharacterized protein n=1 Tax=Puccinia triticina (isolate 1-1 / race 1 (BBBD)) TaxID=630390 RepID=A0A180GRU8_PUCT1|nr:hypothetical protein PTTG_09104 [Puccinia triticina 1-1 BBBD Race 1]